MADMCETLGRSFNEHLQITAEFGIPLGGSVGRAAVMGAQEIPVFRPDGSTRDIDIVDIAQFREAADALPEEFQFDRVWLSPFFSISEGQGELIYPGNYRGIPRTPPLVRVPVPRIDEILEPDGPRRINGIDCLALQPDVQLALDRLTGGPHPKNKAVVAELEKYVAQLPASRRTDPELVRPLREYSDEVDSLIRRKIYVAARNVNYHCSSLRVVKAIRSPLFALARRSHLI